jgi:hypothetical protein
VWITDEFIKEYNLEPDTDMLNILEIIELYEGEE